MSERVAVTGSSGHLGRAVVADLIAHGYDVVGIDRATGTAGPPAQPWDGRSVGTIRSLLDGCDALDPPGRHPRPGGPSTGGGVQQQHPGHLRRAGGGRLGAGIRRVAIASSGSAYGTAWSPQPTRARYVPVDEDHPMINFDPYGLSKEVDERTAAVMARRYAMSVAALRFHWIASRAQQLEAVADLKREPRDWPDQLRSLWGYVDLRDAATACRLAIETARTTPYGFVPLNVVAADSLATVPITELLAEHAPEMEIRRPLGPTEGAFAIGRAAEVIGWIPEHSWRLQG